MEGQVRDDNCYSRLTHVGTLSKRSDSLALYSYETNKGIGPK